ncbi:cytochrome P450 [Thalassobius vesicularis]|uniref:Cytochrome P450 n=1 Tax=Thalassobius vesicularis TaxID=1294297 RepID=A0A4S3M6B5_9RHOB|nr:cytochrome P450 [Thalassobius vesicularis]THD72596.1 cytochrome P450 [Thalassobius vesicularis]
MSTLPRITAERLADPAAASSLAVELAKSGGVGRAVDNDRLFYFGSWERVSAAFADPGLVREHPDRPVPDHPSGRRPSPGLIELDQTWPVFRDPPAHGPLRQALASALFGLPTGDMARIIDDRIGELAKTLRSQDVFDGARDLSPQVPAAAMVALTGFRADAARAVEALVLSMLDRGTPQSAFVAARVALVDALSGALADGIGDGLLSRLRRLMPDAPLPQVLSLTVFVLTTGHGGVRDAISAALWLAATGADQGGLGAAVRSGQSLETAFHETLRLCPPLRMVDRWVAADRSIGRVPLRRGDRVYLLIGAACRDPARFAAPDRFDATRVPARGLGFGSGAHACLGQALAPVLWSSVLRQMLRGDRSVVPNGAAQWSTRSDDGGLESLPLRWA